MDIRVFVKHSAFLILPGIVWYVTAPLYYCYKEGILTGEPSIEIILIIGSIMGAIFHFYVITHYIYTRFIRDNPTPPPPNQIDWDNVYLGRLALPYQPNYNRTPGIRPRQEINGIDEDHPLQQPRDIP